MLSLERQTAIVEYLKKHHSATVAQLSREFFIGPASIRRDLAKLERSNLVKRTYGGAILVEGPDIEIPSRVRRQESFAAKAAIGKLAAACVADNDILFLDSSTTTQQMIPHLRARKNLTIITNSIDMMGLIGESLDCTLYACGGRVRKESMSIVGAQTVDFIRQYRCQKMFFSCNSITPEGLLNASDQEAQLRQAAMETAKRIYFLCDSSKFDKDFFYRICAIERIDTLITEKCPSTDWQERLLENHVELLFPSPARA